MARSDLKKTPSRPIIERTEYSGGTTLFAFAPALYGTRLPNVTVVDPHTRVVLPPTTELEQWLGTDRQTIAAHIAALVESESSEFSALCLQSVEEKSAKSARDIVVQAIETSAKPCRDATDTGTLGTDTTRITRYMQESAIPLEVAYTLYLYAAQTCPDTATKLIVQPKHNPIPPLITHTEERYISRVAFADALYGTGKRLDIFIGDDVVLTIPQPFKWASWIGQEQSTFFGTLNIAIVDDTELHMRFVDALTPDGIVALREAVCAALPTYRQRLRESQAGLPLTRFAIETLTPYLMTEASPLEIAIIAAACANTERQGNDAG